MHAANHMVIALLALCASAAALAAPPSSPPSVEEVLAKLDDLYRSTASVARMEIAVTSPRTSRTLRVKAWSRGEERALVVIESPPREAGIATLRVDANLWNHLPKIGRTVRIPPAMMLGSWMGTDFTNDDLVHESSWRKDFDSAMGGWSDDPPGWTVVARAKAGAVGRWARVEIVVTADEWLPLVMRYYDRRGELARTLLFDEVQTMDGRRIPARMTLVPEGVEGQRTVLRYLEVDFDAQVPDATFTLSELERRR